MPSPPPPPQGPSLSKPPFPVLTPGPPPSSRRRFHTPVFESADEDDTPDIEDIEKYTIGGYYPVNLYDVLNERYKIVHKLGHGGFSTVWLARDQREHRYVALKILVASASDRDVVFLNHLKSHPSAHTNIVHLHDIFTIPGLGGLLHQCLVLSVVGPSLKKIIMSDRKLPKDLAHSAARQIARGVDYLHSMQICHGDLTDSNVLFRLKRFDAWSEDEIYKHLGSPSTAPLRPKSRGPPGAFGPSEVVQAIQYSNLDLALLNGTIQIIDFGESFFIDNPPSKILGTPLSFLAPELMFGWRASVHSDIWALGCLIFELCASRELFFSFFGTNVEALSAIIHTLSPLPQEWRDRYYDRETQLHGFFDPLKEQRHSLSFLVDKITPKLSPIESKNFLDLLHSILQYNPSSRLSIDQILKHKFLSG